MSPIGSYPELAKAYASSFERPAARLGIAADEHNTDVSVANRKADLQAKVQKMKDLQDPNKYKVVQKEDGGYDFFDPEGNQVDIATYATQTGQRPADIVKDSMNPIDIQYVRDHDLLQDYLQAHFDNNQEEIQKFQENDPRLKSVKSPEELIEYFKKTYQRYYVPRTQDADAWGRRPSGPLFSRPDTGDTTSLQSLLQGLGG